MSRQPSHQSVNEDTVPSAHPYSHIPGLAISKAEAAKVTKRVLSLFLSFLISDLIFFSFILSLSYLILSYPLFCSLCYLFSPLLRLSSLLSSTLIYLLLFFLFFSFCSVALLLSFLSDFILSYLILSYLIVYYINFSYYSLPPYSILFDAISSDRHGSF